MYGPELNLDLSPCGENGILRFPVFRIKLHRNCRLSCTEATGMRDVRHSGHPLRRIVYRSKTEQGSCLFRSKLGRVASTNSINNPCSSEEM
jgi:hypothetical protein